MKQTLPFEQIFNLGRLSQAEQTLMMAPDPAERARIARWVGVEEVKALTVEINFCKQTVSQFLVHFKLQAEIEQNCVATLEPMTSSICRGFSRLLKYSPARSQIEPAPHPAILDISEDEGPEEIEDLHYDLAAPVLEELVLAIDPYPRKAAFQPPVEDREADYRADQSPFAVLKSLKSRS